MNTYMQMVTDEVLGVPDRKPEPELYSISFGTVGNMQHYTASTIEERDAILAKHGIKL